MGEFKDKLEVRFGKDAVKSIFSPNDNLELFLI